MKRLLYFFAIIAPLCTRAQIVDGGFESWYDTSGYTSLRAWQHVNRTGAPNVHNATWKDSPGHQGQYALMLSRWYYYDCDIVRQHSSIAFRPASLSGYYRYTNNELTGTRVRDTALLELRLTRWNAAMQRRDTLGGGTLELDASAGYTAFTCPISYLSTEVPDSIGIYISPTKFHLSPGICKDSNWCSFLTIDDLRLEQDTSLGISTLRMGYVRVFPNPVGDALSIVSEQVLPIGVSISDVTGRVMWHHSLSGGVSTLDVSRWQQGIYFLQAKNERFSKVIRILKR